jgi:hypothetical protein
MVCKKNTSGLYWFGPKNALRPVRKGGFVLSLHRSACGRGYKRVREGVSPGLKMRVECVCVTLPEPSQGLGELSVRVIV